MRRVSTSRQRGALGTSRCVHVCPDCMCVCPGVRMHVGVCMCVQARVCVSRCVHVSRNVPVCLNLVLRMCEYLCVFLFARLHVEGRQVGASVCVCLCVCVSVSLELCGCACACSCAWLVVCLSMCVCLFSSLCACAFERVLVSVSMCVWLCGCVWRDLAPSLPPSGFRGADLTRPSESGQRQRQPYLPACRSVRGN